jgi:peptide subunit release factor 1 (eRF1)
MIPADVTDQPVAALDDHLERLLAFEPTSLPVLSVYLNTQADQHGRLPDIAAYLSREFKAIARTWPPTSPERESFDQDAEKILAYVADKVTTASKGVALFACHARSEFFEAVQLNVPLDEHKIYVYNQPHLFNLVRIDDEYPRYAALLTDANRARIYVFGLGQTLETEEVKGQKVHRVKVGGWSQARYQRRVDNAHQAHAKEIIERLGQIVQAENVAHIVLAGDPSILSVVQEGLPKPLADLVIDTVKMDTKASEEDVFTATLDKMREIDAKTDSEKVERLFEQFRAHGLAVLGPQAALEALANGQVDELLISASLEAERPPEEPVAAIVAPEIPDRTGGTESDEPRDVSLPDLLVTKAKRTDASVSFIEDASLLEPADGVGAFLRWRS